MLFAVKIPSTAAHAANAQAEQWRDEAAQWAIQTERWNSLWTWEIVSTLLILALLGYLAWQSARLSSLVERLLNRVH